MVEKKEHHTEHSEHKSNSKYNYWMVATIVLGILLIGILGYTQITKVSANSAGEKLVEFAKSQGVALEVVKVENSGAFYKVTANIQGQQAPFYVSKDGKYFTSSLIEIDEKTTPTPSETPQPTEVPKSDKPKVELFIMSHCPYGTQMQKAILPVANLLNDKIDLEIKWVSYIMHGQKEADEQLVQYCIQKEQTPKYLNYAQCFLADGNTTRCLKNASINTATLNSCIKKTDSEFKINETVKSSTSQYPKFGIHAEENTEYGVQGSPTLVINGVQAQVSRSPAALLQAICNAFNDKPSECSVELPTAQASPGFGYGTSAADMAAAQCS